MFSPYYEFSFEIFDNLTSFYPSWLKKISEYLISSNCYKMDFLFWSSLVAYLVVIISPPGVATPELAMPGLEATPEPTTPGLATPEDNPPGAGLARSEPFCC